MSTKTISIPTTCNIDKEAEGQVSPQYRGASLFSGASRTEKKIENAYELKEKSTGDSYGLLICFRTTAKLQSRRKKPLRFCLIRYAKAHITNCNNFRIITRSTGARLPIIIRFAKQEEITDAIQAFAV